MTSLLVYGIWSRKGTSRSETLSRARRSMLRITACLFVDWPMIAAWLFLLLLSSLLLEDGVTFSSVMESCSRRRFGYWWSLYSIVDESSFSEADIVSTSFWLVLSSWSSTKGDFLEINKEEDVVSKEKSRNVRDVAAKDKEARMMKAAGLLLRGMVWLIVMLTVCNEKLCYTEV